MYRNIEMIFYDLNSLYEKVKVCDLLNIQYAYIKHDKDTNDDGTIKKTHYHLRIFYKDKKSISAWAKFFNVNQNDIQILTDKRLSIRYLIHIDSKDKFLYNYDDIVTNFDISNYFLDKKNESDDILLIINYIKSIKGHLPLSSILNFCLDNDLWSSYRRNYSILKDFVNEHNILYSKIVDK